MNFNVRNNNHLSFATSCRINNQYWMWAIAALLLLPLLAAAFTPSQKVKIGVAVAPENPDDSVSLQLAAQLQQQIVSQLQNVDAIAMSLPSELSNVTSLQQAQRNGCEYLLFINLRTEKTGGRSTHEAIGDAVGIAGNIGGVIDIFRRKSSATQKAESAERAAESAAGMGNGAKSTLRASVEMSWTEIARKTSLNWNLSTNQTSQSGIINDLAKQIIDITISTRQQRVQTYAENQTSEGDSVSQNTAPVTCEAQVEKFLRKDPVIRMGISYDDVRKIRERDIAYDKPANYKGERRLTDRDKGELITRQSPYWLNAPFVKYKFTRYFTAGFDQALEQTHLLYGLEFHYTDPLGSGNGGNLPDISTVRKGISNALLIDDNWEEEKISMLHGYRLRYTRKCGKYSLEIPVNNKFTITDEKIIGDFNSRIETYKKQRKAKEAEDKRKRNEGWKP